MMATRTARDPLAFGALLRHYRLAAGLRQEELAERATISAHTVSNLERGVGHQPHEFTVDALANALRLAGQERAGFVAAARGRRATPHARPAAHEAAQFGVDGPPLVGRARELALLERHVTPAGSVADAETRAAGMPVLALAGEPGIGKSRLLGEAALRAGAQGLRVLAGGAQRQGGQEPYTPLLDALKRHVQAQDEERLRAELQGCAWLVRLLPELADALEPLPAWTIPPEQERRLIFEAVDRFLANVAGPAGTLLLLDDLQWAGPDALALLAALARSAAGAARARPLRLVGAYRDNEVQPGDALAVTLADLAHAQLAAHHTLAPLTPDETERLLGSVLARDMVDRALRQQMVRQAGGVPFYVVSYARELQAGGHAEEAGRADRVPLPWSIAQSVRQRVAALPAPARDVLGVAAIVGRVAPRGLLDVVREHRGDDVIAVLDETCRARLLEEEGATAYRFTHDVIREVVEADLGAARRTLLHRRVAEALEQAAGAGTGELPVEALAYHYSRAEDQEKAVHYLEQAGDRARGQAALAAAEEYYSDLSQRLRVMGRVHDEGRVREKLGDLLYARIQYAPALAAFERAAELYHAIGDLDGEGRVVAHMAYVHLDAGTPEEGIARVQSLLDPLEAVEAWPGLAALYTTLADFLFFSGRYGEHPSVAARAVELARMVGDDGLIANAESSRAGGLLMLGRGREALQGFETAIALAEPVGNLACLGMALTNAASIYMLAGSLDQSLLYAERAIEAATRRGDLMHIALTRLKRAIIFLFTGDWGRSREDLEWITGLSDQLGAAWGFAYPWLALGALDLLEGAWTEGVRYLEDAVAAGERMGDLEVMRWATSRLAEHDVLAGQPHAARDRLLPLLDRPGLEEMDVTILLPPLAWAYLNLGDAQEAAVTVERGIERARRQEHRIALADALWVQAAVATRQGEWATAVLALEEGLALTHAMPYPYAAARLLEAYGALHARRGQGTLALPRLEEALAAFERLGARKDAERVAASRRELRDQGL